MIQAFLEIYNTTIHNQSSKHDFLLNYRRDTIINSLSAEVHMHCRGISKKRIVRRYDVVKRGVKPIDILIF